MAVPGAPTFTVATAATAATAATMAPVGASGTVSSVLGFMASSKVMWGVASIVFNLVARFIAMDLTPAQLTILQHPVTKRIALFCLMFSVTRDIMLSIIMATIISFVLDGFCNEKSQLCVLPKSWVESINDKQRQLMSMMPSTIPLPSGLQHSMHHQNHQNHQGGFNGFQGIMGPSFGLSRSVIAPIKNSPNPPLTAQGAQPAQPAQPAQTPAIESPESPQTQKLANDATSASAAAGDDASWGAVFTSWTALHPV